MAVTKVTEIEHSLASVGRMWHLVRKIKDQSFETILYGVQGETLENVVQDLDDETRKKDRGWAKLSAGKKFYLLRPRHGGNHVAVGWAPLEADIDSLLILLRGDA